MKFYILKVTFLTLCIAAYVLLGCFVVSIANAFVGPYAAIIVIGLIAFIGAELINEYIRY